ncbi:uncharacterized protein B0H18DRAFT_1122940 [Fomitopsis serialis]|uniref:uncharacterized protein n=1 Tax=Fomitopsis serialis TaxID=139415 RepID=UPI00200823EE|nr:uncharacterized protein B0H18DRAFT_1122940 [Neoantrodia serialis]KAH9918689.1 hypothetical protein B0H18DRAFT_1122940 [Neoantrodia serialis]
MTDAASIISRTSGSSGSTARSSTRSVSRGREFYSSGRGGVGNIRRASKDDLTRPPSTPTSPTGAFDHDELSMARGAKARADSSKLIVQAKSTGRGGAGNIRSTSIARAANPLGRRPHALTLARDDQAEAEAEYERWSSPPVKRPPGTPAARTGAAPLRIALPTRSVSVGPSARRGAGDIAPGASEDAERVGELGNAEMSHARATSPDFHGPRPRTSQSTPADRSSHPPEGFKKIWKKVSRSRSRAAREPVYSDGDGVIELDIRDTRGVRRRRWRAGSSRCKRGRAVCDLVEERGADVARVHRGANTVTAGLLEMSAQPLRKSGQQRGRRSRSTSSTSMRTADFKFEAEPVVPDARPPTRHACTAYPPSLSQCSSPTSMYLPSPRPLLLPRPHLCTCLHQLLRNHPPAPARFFPSSSPSTSTLASSAPSSFQPEQPRRVLRYSLPHTLSASSSRQSYSSFTSVSSASSSSTAMPTTPTFAWPVPAVPPLPHEYAADKDKGNDLSAGVSVAIFPPEEDDLSEHLASFQVSPTSSSSHSSLGLSGNSSSSWKPRPRTMTLPTLHEDREYVSFFDLEWEEREYNGSGSGSDGEFSLEAYEYSDEEGDEEG